MYLYKNEYLCIYTYTYIHVFFICIWVLARSFCHDSEPGKGKLVDIADLEYHGLQGLVGGTSSKIDVWVSLGIFTAL